MSSVEKNLKNRISGLNLSSFVVLNVTSFIT